MNNIAGTYKLVSWIKGINGYPWGKNAMGQLIYTSDGHYSVSMMDEKQKEFIFHCGKYYVSDTQIRHCVEMCSRLGFFGTEMVRDFFVSPNAIKLSAVNEDGDILVATWHAKKRDFPEKFVDGL